MSYPIGSLLSVLAGRVQKNLEFVDHFAPEWDPDSPRKDDPPYADTQLLISLLGILIFPHERVPDALGELLNDFDAPLDAIIKVRYSSEVHGGITLPGPDGVPETIDAGSLKDLPRLLRNSIAHFNIRPIDVDGRFGGIRIWNRNRRGQMTFVADMDFDAFRPLAYHILHCLHDREGLPLDDPPDPLEEVNRGL
jgi:hypothetical protein